MTTVTAFAPVAAMLLILIAATAAFVAIVITAWWFWDRRLEAAWARRADAESRAVLDRIARGEERTYTAAEVREILRRGWEEK